ncbi:hypothetical protein PSI23_20750 [Xenorhabdus sp. XENO-10]|uniref:Uncharacterized protein n=1 Tax=Xenorhabdus yunnanensis TaxID=3025878 RepID=A0ABT5LKJ0_9GAMM|nr:hypothetical protein [Xenorhabdus yunnanensis]MDC9591642.1 hypothetical protein [Xenorhabdus yunnanensis]
MNRLARVLFSVLLVSLSFSGHSFQAPDEAINPYQTLITKKHTQHKHEYEHGYEHGYDHGYERGYSHGYEHGYSSDLKHFYNAPQDAPNYPVGFKKAKYGKQKYTIDNKALLHNLRKHKSGKWYKVYLDGILPEGQYVSLHYFEHDSGRPIYDFKVVYNHWSNKTSQIK